jgi:hypothetical protein
MKTVTGPPTLEGWAVLWKAAVLAQLKAVPKMSLQDRKRRPNQQSHPRRPGNPLRCPSANNRAIRAALVGGGGLALGCKPLRCSPAPATLRNSTSAVDMSKEYLRRFKEKKVQELEDNLGDDKLAYNVILAASKAALVAPDLSTKSKQAVADLGSIFSEADGRVKLADTQVVLGQKKTWTYGFDHTTFECLGCSQHHNRMYFPRRGSTARSGRQTIWLMDQSMPAIIPVASHLNCVKIVRLENGSLKDLASGLVDLMSGRQIAAGSVVLLTSASNMADAGTAGYTEGLMGAIQLLRRTLGDHINYGPLPNILFNGASEELIRTNLEVGAWAQQAFRGNDALLRESFVLLESSLVDRGVGGLQSNHRRGLASPLPTTSLTNTPPGPEASGASSLARYGRRGQSRRPTSTTPFSRS